MNTEEQHEAWAEIGRRLSEHQAAAPPPPDFAGFQAARNARPRHWLLRWSPLLALFLGVAGLLFYLTALRPGPASTPANRIAPPPPPSLQADMARTPPATDQVTANTAAPLPSPRTPPEPARDGVPPPSAPTAAQAAVDDVADPREPNEHRIGQVTANGDPLLIERASGQDQPAPETNVNVPTGGARVQPRASADAPEAPTAGPPRDALPATPPTASRRSLAAALAPLPTSGLVDLPVGGLRLPEFAIATAPGEKGPGTFTGRKRATWTVGFGALAALGRSDGLQVDSPDPYAYVQYGRALGQRSGLGLRLGVSSYGTAEENHTRNAVRQANQQFLTPSARGARFTQTVLVDRLASLDAALLLRLAPRSWLQLSAGPRVSYLLGTISRRTTGPSDANVPFSGAAEFGDAVDRIDVGGTVEVSIRLRPALFLDAGGTVGLSGIQKASTAETNVNPLSTSAARLGLHYQF